MSGHQTAPVARRAHVRRQRVEILLGLAALVVVVAWFLALASALVSFGFAVAAAFAWCSWLERHPDDVRGGSSNALRAAHPNVKAVLRLRTPRGAASWCFHPW
jgi:hypothetical protein